ncbi:MAG: hypothetical protein LBI29_00995 [Rickettsiales bacterium]|nr:hypothetical protein [Rickettsiales bacterium]
MKVISKIIILVASVAIFLLVWAMLVEPNLLGVKNFTIKDRELAGLKIVFVGDFHIRSYQKK